ncbi:MAG: 2,4'-dihydroxyacetophenone dioxygenase family protein [Burkholderiales bacterium]|nr:2,4'-dihydroxyacetophenone dioxygenase family protein [Burkholderiales bacterium]
MNKPAELPFRAEDRTPYQGQQPWGMSPDMVIPDVLEHDERMWAPLGPGLWSRPLRHSGHVHAWVIRGKWHYLEHDWVAEEGSYIYEPPGETHTLVVPDDCQDMVTLFTVHGALIYVDPHGQAVGYEDVFTRIEKYRAHFESVGLGTDYIKRFMR